MFVGFFFGDTSNIIPVTFFVNFDLVQPYAK
jgi:hypothetical protein